jgi:hypothetical protein
MVASEESVLHEVLAMPDQVWAPRAGEPLIARIEGMPWPIPGDLDAAAGTAPAATALTTGAG